MLKILVTGKQKYDSIYTKFKTCKTKNILQTYVLKL